MSEWKLFKDSKPTESGPYLVVAEFKGKRLALVANWVLQGDSGFWFGCDTISHWTEIPAIPVIELVH